MALADALKTPPARDSRGRSILDIWLETLTLTDRTAVVNALHNPEWRHYELQAALEAEGAPKVADTTFGTWRRKVTNR